MENNLNNQIVKKSRKWIWITLGIIVVVIFFLFKSIFPIDVYTMEGVSMEPTIIAGQSLVLDKFDTNYQHGDIVVFKYKTGALVKRVVALPGETIEVKEGAIFINGQKLVTPAILKVHFNLDHLQSSVSRTLGTGEYFMIGDNTAESYDSRNFGPIKFDSILGKIVE